MDRLFFVGFEKEEKRLKWMLGFFLGQKVVTPTIKNRPEWTKEEVTKELQTTFLDAAYTRFFEYMKKKYEVQQEMKKFYRVTAERSKDEAIFLQMAFSEEYCNFVKNLIRDRIPVLVKEKYLEKIGCKSKYRSFLKQGDWESILEKFNNECAYCGFKQDLTMDHVVPTSKNGKDAFNNIVPACRSCNSSKNNKDLESWYFVHPYFTESRYQKILQHLSCEVGELNDSLSLF